MAFQISSQALFILVIAVAAYSLWSYTQSSTNVTALTSSVTTLQTEMKEVKESSGSSRSIVEINGTDTVYTIPAGDCSIVYTQGFTVLTQDITINFPAPADNAALLFHGLLTDGFTINFVCPTGEVFATLSTVFSDHIAYSAYSYATPIYAINDIWAIQSATVTVVDVP